MPSLACLLGPVDYPLACLLASLYHPLHSLQFNTLSTFGDYYGSRLSAFFVPPANGSYTFLIRGDDTGALYFSGSDATAPLERIAYFERQTSSLWPSWPMGTTVAPQSAASAKIDLIAGRRYYLEMRCAEVSGSDYCGVGFRLHTSKLRRYEPDPRVPQSRAVQHEQQQLTLTMATLPAETQLLRLDGSSDSDAKAGEWVRIVAPGYGSGESLPLRRNASAVEAEAALAPLLGVNRTVEVEPYRTFDLDEFETADDLWHYGRAGVKRFRMGVEE
jgi:hypothetical protein